MGGKISKTWAKYGVFAFIKVKNGPNRAKKGLKRAEDRVVVAKNTFFAWTFCLQNICFRRK